MSELGDRAQNEREGREPAATEREPAPPPDPSDPGIAQAEPTPTGEDGPATGPSGPGVPTVEPTGGGEAPAAPAPSAEERPAESTGPGIASAQPPAGEEARSATGGLEDRLGDARSALEGRVAAARDAFEERPELFVGGAFAGGLALALLLRGLGRG